SHLLAARRREPLPEAPLGDPFSGLAEEYPRAWACLGALRQALNSGGGRVGYKMPDALPPELPNPSEVVEAPDLELESLPETVTGVVFSGIDPRFDQVAFGYLKAAHEDELMLGLS